MQSDSLGGVELRARMTGDQVGAAIVVERHDIHLALSNELPALHSALVEKNVRVQTLSISQGTQTLLGDGSGTEMSGRGFECPRPRAQATGQSEGNKRRRGAAARVDRTRHGQRPVERASMRPRKPAKEEADANY